jgi:hypothetical protein
MYKDEIRNLQLDQDEYPYIFYTKTYKKSFATELQAVDFAYDTQDIFEEALILKRGESKAILSWNIEGNPDFIPPGYTFKKGKHLEIDEYYQKPTWQLYAGTDDTFLGEYDSEAQAKRAARFIYDNHSKLIEPRFRWNIYLNNHFNSSLVNMTEEEKLLNPRNES